MLYKCTLLACKGSIFCETCCASTGILLQDLVQLTVVQLHQSFIATVIFFA